jgi:hypothetical protein
VETTFARRGFTRLNRVPSGEFNRVKMDVTKQFPEIDFFLADDGLDLPRSQVRIVILRLICFVRTTLGDVHPSNRGSGFASGSERKSCSSRLSMPSDLLIREK